MSRIKYFICQVDIRNQNCLLNIALHLHLSYIYVDCGQGYNLKYRYDAMSLEARSQLYQ